MSHPCSDLQSFGGNFDNYLDSDDEGVMYTRRGDSSESDDESGSRLALLKQQKGGEVTDDFEKDMASELSVTMKKLTGPIEDGMIVSGATKKESDKQFYDNIYFDSDDSDDEGEEGNFASRRKVRTNDELFYCPDMDDKDQEYVDNIRRKCHLKQKKSKKSDTKSQFPDSDAVLNCPACFTTLCLDCQRHSIYNDQYRAMFVLNCRIDFSETLKFPKKVDRKQFKKKFKKSKNSNATENPESAASTSNGDGPEQRIPNISTLTCSDDKDAILSDSAESNNTLKTEDENSVMSISDQSCYGSLKVDSLGEDLFYPVKCADCNTKVAVYDKDEIYHFFGVLASY